MKLRHPWLIQLCGLLGACLFRLWMATVEHRNVPRDRRGHPYDPRRARHIYTFWHEAVLLGASIKAPIHVLISQHADGELITQVCRRLGIGVVRGSSTRGGSQGLLGMIRRGRRTHLVVTPDGPHGPRRRVQPGLLFLASATGLPIVPIGIGFTAAWRARSWDRLAIPKPWSRAVVVVDPEIHVPPNLDRAELERYRQLVEAVLHRVTDEAERRAAGLPPVAAPAVPLRASA
jgi:lysophospholipid acyltransferase (LPLAT)-like uncharacterized protein